MKTIFYEPKKSCFFAVSIQTFRGETWLHALNKLEKFQIKSRISALRSVMDASACNWWRSSIQHC